MEKTLENLIVPAFNIVCDAAENEPLKVTCKLPITSKYAYQYMKIPDYTEDNLHASHDITCKIMFTCIWATKQSRPAVFQAGWEATVPKPEGGGIPTMPAPVDVPVDVVKPWPEGTVVRFF